jgi:hypothetical protein
MLPASRSGNTSTLARAPMGDPAPCGRDVGMSAASTCSSPSAATSGSAARNRPARPAPHTGAARRCHAWSRRGTRRAARRRRSAGAPRPPRRRCRRAAPASGSGPRRVGERQDLGRPSRGTTARPCRTTRRPCGCPARPTDPQRRAQHVAVVRDAPATEPWTYPARHERGAEHERVRSRRRASSAVHPARRAALVQQREPVLEARVSAGSMTCTAPGRRRTAPLRPRRSGFTQHQRPDEAASCSRATASSVRSSSPSGRTMVRSLCRALSCTASRNGIMLSAVSGLQPPPAPGA